ncbi:ankyrin repeat domain-containing protein [Tundrisphaera sp. TA3]|uniref:ankyrin repeat domain-containing protein n=1 Tax=Tundrisphaera sp. TA3 TaxID=3435775 RepID=UPI003EB88BA8
MNDPETFRLVEWFDTVRSGDVARVAELLDTGIDVDSRDPMLGTALRCAVANKDHAMVRLLLARGADPEDTCLFIMEPSWPDEFIDDLDDPGTINRMRWFSAARSRDVETIAAMLDLGADVNARDPVGFTALKYAASEQDHALIRILLERGADPNDPSLELKCPSWPAAFVDDLVDPEMIMPLEWAAAAKSGDMDKIVELLDSGFDIDFPEPATALFSAICFGHHDLIRLLIDRGASLDPVISGALTALSAAILRAHPWADSECTPDPVPLRILLGAGARYRLYDAVLIDDIPLARQRLEEGANPNFAEGSYYGPILMIAARHGQLGMVDLLLDHGADIEGMDDLGSRPLIEAASNGHTPVVRRLLERGADLDADAWCGRTALSEAAIGGHRELCMFLIAMGAERGVVDALMLDDCDRLATLLDARIDEGEGDVDRLTGGRARLTMLAIEHGKLPMVRLLLGRGAQDHRRDEERTLLSHAAKYGQVEAARLLIDRGMDLHTAGRDGLSPLAWAIRAGHGAVADLLREAGATH